MRNRQNFGDTSPEDFRKQLHELADWIAYFRQNLGALPVAPKPTVAGPGAILAALPAEPPEEGEPFEKILGDIDRDIVPGMVHWSHPMFLGYFGWTTTAPAILGEIITAPLNVNAMTWRTCPAATELETLVVDWIRQWMHLPQEVGGVVYDTASVGVMHALAVAREEAAPSVRKHGLVGAGAPVFRIYASEQAHSSAEKAAIALGLGEENVQRVPTDSHFRMNLGAMREMIARDVASRGRGIRPMAVIATVGTTSTASVDPVPEIATICREGMADRLREFVRLANLFADWINSDNGFELVAPVSMGVVCFRYIGSDPVFAGSHPSPSACPAVAPYLTGRPNESDLDALNSEIVERINASGSAYLTQTKLHGRTVMRIGLGNVLTTEKHLGEAWEMIQETAKQL